MGLIEVIIIGLLMLSGAVTDVEPEIVEMPEIVTQQEQFIEIIEEPEPEIIYPEHWTCFDFAMNYSELHPEWGMVVISDNPRFQDMNHIVNYQINDDESLQIISYVKQDEGYKVIEYVMGNWWYDSDTFDFLHFYIDGEIPTRYYNRVNAYQIKPNAEVFYNAL